MAYPLFRQTAKPLCLCLMVLAAVVDLGSCRSGAHEVPLNELASLVKSRKARRIEVRSDSILVESTGGEVITAKKEKGESAIRLLLDFGVTDSDLASSRIVVSEDEPWLSVLGKPLLYVLLIGIAVILVGGGIMSGLGSAFAQAQRKTVSDLTQSNAALFSADAPTTTWQQIAGASDAKRILQENAYFFKNPSKLVALGGRLRRGVLLVGAPGTGKTMLARAMASDIGAKCYSMSGASFVEVYVGVGAARVRDLFSKARSEQAAVVFIDEIDAVGRRRSSAPVGGAMEYDQALNQLLVELDGFDRNNNLMILAATNRRMF